ncbi:MAG: septation regulator SpoVG [Ruminococcus sp.]|nr:septation regulator SpoVG [Ruminococcus sp.]
MTITDIKVRKTFEDGKLKGVVSVTFDNYFAVHDIKIVQGEERLFVAMPSRRDDNGTFRDIVHPISQEARTVIENSILDAYLKEQRNTPLS